MVDLRKAKPGDVYVDGHGCKVRILCNDRKVEHFKVVALCMFNGLEEVETYTLDGSYWGSDSTKSTLSDLVKRINE